MRKYDVFENIKLPNVPRSGFDMSSNQMFTGDMGWLYPIGIRECLPGDNWTIGCNSLNRFAPIIAPVMNRFDVSMHYWFVPNRIVWPDFYEWLYGHDTNLVAPYIQVNDGLLDSSPLLKYMGMPDVMTGVQNISALPLAAFQAIYHEFYRDENLVSEFQYKLVSGNNNWSGSSALYTQRKSAWTKDYFTSALPWAQKGGAVDLPIGTASGLAPIYRESLDGLNLNVQTDIPGETAAIVDAWTGQLSNNRMYANLANAQISATTINELRNAFATQAWLEKNARAGTRPDEGNYAHFKVKTKDFRLQRPEYITGITTPVTISEVLNTTGEEGGLPQGNMAGRGVAYTEGKFGNYFCEEHGFIIGVMRILPQASYYQGIPRFFGQRYDKNDYYWADFARLGEQEILMKELYANALNPEATFGYTPRYAEYMQNPDTIAGDFRSTLKYWTMARTFASEPALNQTFIECSPGKDIFAVQGSENSLYFQVNNMMHAVRPVSKYATPATF